jgi:hypothetical protein
VERFFSFPGVAFRGRTRLVFTSDVAGKKRELYL